MSTVAFDTYRVVKRSKEVGFSDLQAEAVTDVLSESRSPGIDLSLLATKNDLERFATKADLERFAAKADLEQFATKADLERFATKADLERFATKADLERFATKSEMAHLATKAELSEMKADLLKWVVGAIGLQTLVVVGAVVTLARAL